MKRVLVLAVFGTVVAASVAVCSAALAEPGGGGRGGRAAGRAARQPRGEARANRRAGMHLLRELNLTDAQKALLKESRDATEAVRKDFREKITAIRQEAKSGNGTKECRKAMHAKAKELISSTLQSLQPQAQKILESLTPDQRAILLRVAAAHGKPADDATLLRGISRLLLRGGHRQRK